MVLFTAMLMLQCLRRSRTCWRRCTGAVLRGTGLQKEYRVQLGWAAGYALVALTAGAAGMAGIAAGLSLHPFIPLLALSALTLAASLLFGIAALLARMSTLPQLGVDSAVKRFR
jgi:hypothetical protein